MSISVAEVRLWIRDVLLLETQYPEFKPQFDNLRNFLKDIRNLETSDKSGLLELAEKYITDKENIKKLAIIYSKERNRKDLSIEKFFKLLQL